MAAWAEACQHPRDRNQAALAAFWAAYLHSLVAREACEVATAGNVANTDPPLVPCGQPSCTVRTVPDVEEHHQLNAYTDVPAVQSEVSKYCLRTLMANMADEVVGLAEECGFPNRWTLKERVRRKAVAEWEQCHEVFNSWPWDNAWEASL